MKVMNGLVMTLEEDKIFLCVWLLYYVGQFCQFANEGAKISIKSYFMKSFFFIVFSSSEVLAKIASVQSKLPTAACWSREKKRGNCEVNLFYVESSFGTTDTTDKSFTVFFAHWGIKFYCQVKISARWVKIIWPLSCMSCRDEGKACNHILITLHFHPFWFPCLRCDLIWPLMSRCVTTQVSVNSQIREIKTSHFHFYW